MSVVCLSAMMAVWSRAVEAEVPGATANSYADDGDVSITRPTAPEAEAALQSVSDITE